MRGLRGYVLSASDLSDWEIGRWEQLCWDRRELSNPFLTPHFTRAVAVARPRVRVCVIRQNDTAVGFFPFQYATPMHEALGSAEPVGGSMSDYFGVVAEPDLNLRGQELLKLAGLTHLSFTHLDETQLQHGLEGESPEPGLRIQFPEGGAVYWEALRRSDKKLGEDTLRRERQLAAQVGPIKFQLQETDWQAPLEHLIDRKRDQYRRTASADCLAPAWKQQLLKHLAAQQEPSCGGMLSTLHAGDTWVASHFGLRFGDLLHYWFPVYNPDLHRFAPGRLLLKQILEGSASAGLRQIDRGVGDSPAKRDFANHRHNYYRGAWFRPGLRSTACRAALSLQWRWQSYLSTRQATSA